MRKVADVNKRENVGSVRRVREVVCSARVMTRTRGPVGVFQHTGKKVYLQIPPNYLLTFS